MKNEKLELLIEELKWLETYHMMLQSAINENDEGKKEEYLSVIKKRATMILGYFQS